MRPPLIVRGRDLPDALARLDAEPRVLLALGRPVCPACALLPASLAAIAGSRPGLALCVADMVDAADWAVREEALWPRGIRVSPASVPVLALLERGRVVATRQGGAPAHLLDDWLTEHIGPSEHPLPPEVTGGEAAVLEATAARRAQHGAVRER